LPKLAASPAGACAVLPAVEHGGEHARGPALLVDVVSLDELLDEPDLIVGVEDGEIGPQPDQLGMVAQDARPDRVEGAEPRHAFHDLPDHLADPPLHLAGRLVGEGDGQHLRRARPAQAQDVGDPGGEHPCLARPGAGQHQYRSIQGLDGFTLLGIEPL